MRSQYNWSVLILLFLAFICFVLRGNAFTDPDLGWHIQAGTNILAHGIPYYDPFSYSMPSFPFVDHEWLTNIFLSRVYLLFGTLPLTIFFALLATGAIFIQIIQAPKKWVLLPLFLACGALFDFVGIRPQIITILFVSILITMLLHKKLFTKWHFALPFLFMLWANVHGGFGIGLGILTTILFIRIIKHRKTRMRNSILLIICSGATLINPFGIRLWGEFLMQLTDSSLHWSIQEWFPPFFFGNFAFWFFDAISLSLVLRYRKHFSFETQVLYCLFFVASMSSLRNIPLFMIIALKPTILAINYFANDAKKIIYGEERFIKSYIGFYVICLFFFLPQLGIYLYEVYINHHGQQIYPTKAVAYLRTHLPKQQLFASYDLGGYLIWQLPEKKVFIDGRMPSWRRATAPPNESTYAFEEYRRVMQKKMPFASFSNKYAIDIVLASTMDLQEKHHTFLGIDLEKVPVIKQLIDLELPFFPVVAEIKREGWKEIYHDDKAVIFQKPTR